MCRIPARKQARRKVNASLANDPKPQPVQGVFVMRKEGRKFRAVFVPVKTGITGASDIEVTSGLQPGDEIITGPYRVLRILKDNAVVKQDTSPATTTEQSSS